MTSCNEPARKYLGRGLKSCPDQDGDDLNGSDEVNGVFFEAGGDAAGVFDLVEEAFDEIALPIQDLAVASRHSATSGGRDAGSNVRSRRNSRNQSAS